MIGVRTQLEELRAVEVLSAETVTTPYQLTVAWNPAPGATQAVVDAASFDIETPIPSELPTEQFQPAMTQVDGQSKWDVTVPSGLRVRSLALQDLKDVDGNGISDQPFPEDSRLAVSLPDPRGGFAAPLFAVPAVGGHGLFPASLTGASFAGGVLSLPDVQAAVLRLAIVSNDPADFEPRNDVTLSTVSGVGVRYPSALQLTDESGAVVWANPKDLPPTAAPLHVDLKATLQKALNDELKAAPGQPLSVTFTLSTATPVKLVISSLSIRGALVRSFSGVTRTTVTGDPAAVAPALGPGGPPLVIDATAHVSADVTLHYDGLRLLPFSDAPPPPEQVRGRIVGADAVIRVLPPQGLAGQRVARIGLIGYAPEPCELSVRLVRPLTGEPLPGDPAVVRLQPSTAVATVWTVFPTPVSPTEPAAVAARATKGRFFWTTDLDDRPRVRIAVLDEEPSPRQITLGGVVLPDDPAQPHRPGVDLTASFAAPSPEFEGDLFYTVDLSDLTVRYQR